VAAVSKIYEKITYNSLFSNSKNILGENSSDLKKSQQKMLHLVSQINKY
jgi:hypothetical protein